jgi:putative endonuclease
MDTFRRLQSLFRARRSRIAGARGEILAAGHLRAKGYTVVARNWRNPRDRREEIDLVCRDGAALVFVEVKTRSARARVPGYYAVDARKRQVLRRVIGSYLSGLHPAPRTFRFDVVEVGWRPEGPRLLHFSNVRLFSKHYRRAG